jgi:hypothetical protein
VAGHRADPDHRRRAIEVNIGAALSGTEDQRLLVMPDRRRHGTHTAAGSLCAAGGSIISRTRMP